MNTYIAYVYKDPNSSFGVSFPDLPGCYGAGDSYDEALENAKISLREYALALSDDGQDMPKPRKHSELAGDTTEAIEMAKSAFVAEVPLVVLGGKRRVNVSLDDKVLAAIDRACVLARVNRSVFLADAAKSWMQDKMGAVFVEPSKKKKRRKSLNPAHS
jgi:predicted RNase H-like HicB family nuclease